MRQASAGDRWAAQPVNRDHPSGSWWVRSLDNNWPGVCAGGYLTRVQAEAVAKALNEVDALTAPSRGATDQGEGT